MHYGGDSGVKTGYRKGTLYFYNNTVISTRQSNTTLLRLSTNDESAWLFNNILYITEDGSRLALLEESGSATMDHNWLKSGWRDSHSSSFAGTVTNNGFNIEGSDPRFVDFAGGNYGLSALSLAVDSGVELLFGLSSTYPLDFQYLLHQQSETRLDDGALDMGAFETLSEVVGDIDNNGEVELADVILALRVMAGYQDQVFMQAGSDVGGDGKVTLQEALFGLQQMTTVD